VPTSAHAHPALAHQFDSLDQQRESATLGMWCFLITEIMFFGGFFAAYLIYRYKYPGAFVAASHHLEIGWGLFNTVVLICSSLTMALAIWSAKVDRRKQIVYWLLATMLLGATFLGVKAHEYHQKWEHHLIPGAEHFVPGHEFRFDKPEYAREAQIFFSLYFGMTGLHAAHMIIGLGILAFLLRPAWRGRFTSEHHNFLEGMGLYWHFVDIVWIFLFPLLYLIGQHHVT
jgi:cytochrome c oxidase subunit 3